MADATKSITKVTKVIEVDEPTVLLTLTNDEAQFLADVFAKIGGSPKTTRRKYQDSITGALVSVGVFYNSRLSDIDGGLKCR